MLGRTAAVSGRIQLESDLQGQGGIDAPDCQGETGGRLNHETRVAVHLPGRARLRGYWGWKEKLRRVLAIRA